MAATAPRTTKPVATTRPTRGATRVAGSVAPPRPKIPSMGVVKDTAGPVVKLGNAAAAKDPRFQKVMDKLDKSASKAREHPSAKRKAAEAEAAAQPPANEKLAGAQAQQVDTMKGAETKKPDPDSFLTLLRAEIEKAMPKKLGDTEKFMQGENKAQLQGAVTGNVNQQKADATGGLKAASDEKPDPGKIAGSEATPLPPTGAPPAPPAVNAADAMPAPKPNAEVSLQKSKDEANQSLTKANVTPEQLRKANDPRFSAVLTAKSAAEKQADSAPQKYRADEQKTLGQAAAKATNDEKQGMAALQTAHGKSTNSVKERQLAAKAQDEAKRKAVTDHIQGIFAKTKQAVDNKLNSLEQEVSTLFDKGLEAAMNAMTSYIDARMHQWKLNRYILNPFGPALWLKDKLFGLPDEVNAFYAEGRNRFTQALDTVIVQIAKLVDTRLKEAKDTIASGQKEVSDYVQQQPKDLQAVAQSAEKEMTSRFDELRQGVDDKKNDLAQNLAQRYKEASDKADTKLKEMQDENKGLVSVLREKLGEVMKILGEFRERISGMLKQGQNTIMLIVAHPIDFLKNLINAIKKGISQFVDNIWTHLKAGFLSWLFGSLAEMGIEMPKDFSLGSILKLVLQVLGLTYPRIRAKAVKLVGERTVKILETAADFVAAFVTGGAAALWEKVKEYLGNLKEMLINAVQEWVVTSVIKAAVTKLISMFNPVGAIIQAIMAIYNTVMFFIERINQILDFVQAIISSVFKIATGDISSAANWIEQALARAIPVIIGFLARLLGLSGLSDKIKGFILKIQDKVDKAIDLVIQKIVSGIGKLFGKGKEEKPDERTPEQKQQDLDKGLAEAEQLLEAEDKDTEDIRKLLPLIKSKYRMATLELITDEEKDTEETDHIEAEVNPSKKGPKKRKLTKHKSHDVTREQGKYMLRKELRNKEYTRDKCYGKSYREAVYDWKKKQLQKMHDPANPKKYVYNHTSYDNDTATIDHRPMIVQHWNDIGRKKTQGIRKDFFNDYKGGHLAVVPASINSSMGASAGENYDYRVTIDFRGPDD